MSANTNYSLHRETPSMILERVLDRCQSAGLSPTEERELHKLAVRSLLELTTNDSKPALDASEHLLSVLEHPKDIEQKDIVVLYFLRLISEKTFSFLAEKPWRARVVALFDTQFAETLYVEKRIENDLQGHEKIERLQQLMKEYQSEFLKSLESLTSLDLISNHRHRLLKVLNTRTGRFLIHPFVPVNVEALFSEVYKRIETYIAQREDLGVVDARMHASAGIQDLNDALQSSNTAYSLLLKNKVGERLQYLLDEDFLSNKATQPANVLIDARDKKYPLNFVGSKVNVGFSLTNSGPGYAYDVKIEVAADDNVKLATEIIDLGRISPSDSISIDLPIEITQSSKQIDVMFCLSWHDFDETARGEDLTFTLFGQRSDICWEALEQTDPYSLEPVISEQELVGRKDVLNRLIGIVGIGATPNVGSSIINGQKRVGKTSIAKSLHSHLANLGFLAIYLEGGNYVEPSATATVARLGTKLCKEIRNAEASALRLDVPQFHDALSPLDEFIDDFTKTIPDRKIIIILDEFDELPLELYAGNALGNAFFLTLRSISSRPRVGFVLVGGEKMAHVMDCQGAKLNKWVVTSVDYFNRDTDWGDYRELVQRPVSDTLEYTENALFALHEATAGNPYFTKLICQRIFQSAVSRRDCYITEAEVDQAIQVSVRDTDKNTFQHFWDDGIADKEDIVAEKSVRRRKVLIATSDVLAKLVPAPGSKIAEQPLTRDIPVVDNTLKEFVERKVLVSTVQDTYDFKVQLFRKWLDARGVNDVISTFNDLDTSLRIRQQEERTRVNANEINALLKGWGTYRGQAINEGKVRTWLDQFEGNREQRAMFTLLQGLRFYSNDFLRNKMKEVQGMVSRKLSRKFELGKKKRSDILISYLDNPAKSGAELARLYADEAEVYTNNVIEKSRLADVIKEREGIQAIIFIDDFIGTGKSAITYLEEIIASTSVLATERNIKLIFIGVVAFIDGVKHIENAVSELDLVVQPYFCDVLDESTRCFGDSSKIFPDQARREDAKSIAMKYGNRLEKNCPLGYGDLELAVVFERGCPNNSLPILWSDSPQHKWTPLFKRQ